MIFHFFKFLKILIVGGDLVKDNLVRKIRLKLSFNENRIETNFNLISTKLMTWISTKNDILRELRKEISFYGLLCPPHTILYS